MVKADDWKEYLRKNKLLSFSFVRHPFERLVSAYKDKVLSNDGHYFKYSFRNAAALRWYQNNKSFPAFVDLVLNGYKGIRVPNVHWSPITPHCKYCEIEYDVIGRIETFREDVQYIVVKNNLQNVLPLEKSAVAMNSKKTVSTYSTHDYLSQLSKAKIDSLYKFYQLDFELFGYDVTSYFKNN